MLCARSCSVAATSRATIARVGVAYLVPSIVLCVCVNVSQPVGSQSTMTACVLSVDATPSSHLVLSCR